LLEVKPEKAVKREQLFRFIQERFLLSENASPETKLQALDQLVAFAARGST